MSKKEENKYLSDSDGLDEPPPLPDEPIPETIPVLNTTKAYINKSRLTENLNQEESGLISSLEKDSILSENCKGSLPVEDGWKAIFDPQTRSYYFWNSKTNETTWKNPRAPEDTSNDPRKLEDRIQEMASERSHPYKEYVFTARFNRMTGKWQNDPNKIPENFTEDARALRQQSFYFDVEGTAAAHDGRSFLEERRQKRLTKKELALYKKQNKKKKEQRKREWLLED
ncbi:hypothetical protein PNEG_01556 [Pneumocystis murina B123]|uniref:WW domain-containing protein n=1 Tax=Pneumocystis murina (strain B123) TaxID=1069680 RepID=M7P8Z4_PNEMU|nr:hypothetical protein PNEG_01556 [Pneumocystis murina B123]EMR10295.1 hypothetical protein PNEG_01556 [Pneumocystis murina B123]